MRQTGDKWRQTETIERQTETIMRPKGETKGDIEQLGYKFGDIIVDKVLFVCV